MLQLIWLIPLLPLVGVAVNGLFGRRLPRQAVGATACPVCCWPAGTSGSHRPPS